MNGQIFAEVVMYLSEHFCRDMRSARHFAGEATMRLPEGSDFPSTLAKAIEILEARKAA
jgi:hypothetical protein